MNFECEDMGVDLPRLAAVGITGAVSLREAKALGLTRYFTGLPCNHGHISERRVKSKGCVACRSARRRGVVLVSCQDPITKACADCGSKFISVFLDKIYCNNICSRKAAKRRSSRRDRILLKAAKQLLQQGELPT